MQPWTEAILAAPSRAATFIGAGEAERREALGRWVVEHAPTAFGKTAQMVVRDVCVGGVQVVCNGVVTTIDYTDAARRLHAAGVEAERNVAQHHYAGHTARQVSPLSLPGPE